MDKAVKPKELPLGIFDCHWQKLFSLAQVLQRPVRKPKWFHPIPDLKHRM
tara:strand:- start:893 stop:1042 length:150 start_codon:yes stop_codon:yes gene_type:complete